MTLLTQQQAKRLKLIKEAQARVNAQRKTETRRKIEELQQGKQE